MKPSVLVVLDIGKSNVKLSVIEANSGKLLESLKTPNSVEQGEYPHAPIEAIWGWYGAGLKNLALRYQISYLS
ncbi:MAG TPA: hypothetical protein PLM98_10255, partial [Thiolinea sp.]|nr:hypothetical protein [Thiolinea sp.]